MNGQSQKLTLWLLGAMFTIVVVTLSALFAFIDSRFDRNEQRLDRMEQNIQAIQQEYYRIAVVETKMAGLEEDVQELLRLARGE